MILAISSLKEIEERVSLYNSLYYVFAILAVVFLLLSLLLFFKFNIIQIIAFKTGKDMKKSIKKIESQNSESGNLSAEHQVERKGKRQGGAKLWNTDPLDVGKDNGRLPESEESAHENLQGIYEGQQEINNHNIISRDYDMTSALNEDNDKYIGQFRIIRNIMIVHTEETL